MSAFAADAARATRGRFDRTVSFHMVPGFDAIFCTDPARPVGPWWKNQLPRYRTYAALEAGAFSVETGSLVMALSGVQLAAIRAHHGLAEQRGTVLPPAVDRARLNNLAIRRARRPVGLPVWLWVGLQPKTKGLDRVITALAAAPAARLVVCGLGRHDPKARGALRLARRLGVQDRIEWKGFQTAEGMAQAIAGADLMVHPARTELTGNVILEALINGLPVVATEVCGFAEHIQRGEAGVVLDAPFRQVDLNRVLASAEGQVRHRWSCNALAYAEGADFFGGVARAADLVEAWDGLSRPEPLSAAP